MDDDDEFMDWDHYVDFEDGDEDPEFEEWWDENIEGEDDEPT
jgi:hypothetical protein